MKANQDIRTRLKAATIPIWKLADEISVSEATLVRWLRTELSGDRKVSVESALSRLEAISDES